MKDRHYASVKEIEHENGRTGDCDYKKCKAACCRFVTFNAIENSQQEKFFKGFGFEVVKLRGSFERYLILRVDCKHLDKKTFKCKIQKTKSWACKHFPIPSDNQYKLVRKVCSYKFPKKKKVAKMQW